jgi:hypothetical protein
MDTRDKIIITLLWFIIASFCYSVGYTQGRKQTPNIVYTLNSKYGEVQDITAMQGTWNEFKLDLVDTVRKSDRTDEEKVKIINEIMSIPTQLPTEAPK